MNKFKGIIFDLDGTLVDSLEDIADSMNEVLHRRNFPLHDYPAYKYFIGNGIKKLVTRTLPEAHLNEELINECFNEMNELYSHNYLNKTKPYDGIKELFNKLVSYELKLAVFSNKPDKFTKEIVKELLPEVDFVSVKGLTDESLKKPNPQIALEISKKMQLDSEDILYVGDTSIDMQTANNAKMYAVGVLWGFRTKDELIEYGAKSTIEKPIELLEIVQR